MAKNRDKEVRVRGIRRAKVDEKQIAIAYVLLAQAILAAKDEGDDASTEGATEAGR